jgi:hypothetical protein
MRVSKTAFYAWKQGGRQQGSADHHHMQEARRDLRRTQRQAAADIKRKAFNEVMEASVKDQKRFYRIIGKQRGNKSCQDLEMEFGGQTTSGQDVVGAWADYFESLATPDSHPPGAVEAIEHEHSVELQLILIEEIENQCGAALPKFTASDVERAIRAMKNNKASDELGVTSEHLKFAMTGVEVTTLLAHTLNQIVARKRTPAVFSTGVVNPILKKGKIAKLPDSYRRITITTLLGKILEHLTLVPQKEILAKTQNPLQRGFSEQASSTNTAFFLTEAVAEARDQKTPLYLTLLDASKAFDVIWHASMLVALYWPGIHGDMWTMAASVYQNMSSKIRWNGLTSRTITEGQGI